MKRLAQLSIGAGLVLSACGNPPEIISSDDTNLSAAEPILQSPNITRITADDAANFSTAGKPTKFVYTDKGGTKIYDIRKDPQVTAAISQAYARGDVTFGDVSFGWLFSDEWYTRYIPDDIKAYPEAKLLSKARTIAEYDLYRSGCKQVEYVPCGNGASGWGAKYWRINAADYTASNLGAMPDFSQEAVNWKASRVAEKFLTDEIRAKGRFFSYNDKPAGSAVIDECNHFYGDSLLKYYYMGEGSDYSLEQTTDYLTHFVCKD